MKSNIDSNVSYVWLFLQDFPQTDCMLKIYVSYQLEQFLMSFTWKNVSTSGLLYIVN